MFTLFMISVLTLPQLPLTMFTNLILTLPDSELFPLFPTYNLTPLFSPDNQLALDFPCPPYLHFRCCLGHFYAFTLVVKAALRAGPYKWFKVLRARICMEVNGDQLSILAAEIRC